MVAEREQGWHTYSPQDPDLPDDLRQLHRDTPDAVARGEVHVLVFELEPGQSEVRVRVDPAAAEEDGLSQARLIDAAIVELHLAQQVFLGEGDG